jgi:hypothetical protein
LTSYTCHLLLLDPALGPVQQAEAYIMLFSTTSDISWLRSAIALCENTPGIRRGLEGCGEFEKWKRLLAQLEKGEEEEKVELGKETKMEDTGDLKMETEENEEKMAVKIEQSEGFANEVSFCALSEKIDTDLF